MIDANLNRTKEALRVCEDTARFIFNSKKVTHQYKIIRHKLMVVFKGLGLPKTLVIEARDIERDVGKKSIRPEFQRKNVRDVFYANSQRIKESLRVLEEFTKLLSGHSAQEFKKLRYRIYALEKEIVEKF